jgi:hypothetical protein
MSKSGATKHFHQVIFTQPSHNKEGSLGKDGEHMEKISIKHG